jgi:hypothetical protein
MCRTAVIVNGSNPKTLQKFPFHRLILIILPFHFQDKGLAIGEPDDVVRSKLANDAAEPIRDLKSKMIILDPSQHMRTTICAESAASCGTFPTLVSWRPRAENAVRLG